MYDTIVLLLLSPRPFLDRDVQGFARSRVWLSRRAGRRGSSPDRAGFGWITAPSRSGRQAEGPAAARAGGDAASPQPPASSRDAARAGGGLATPRPGSRAPRGVPAGSGARVSGLRVLTVARPAPPVFLAASVRLSTGVVSLLSATDLHTLVPCPERRCPRSRPGKAPNLSSLLGIFPSRGWWRGGSTEM